jgi:hypothetical protein
MGEPCFRVPAQRRTAHGGAGWKRLCAYSGSASMRYAAVHHSTPMLCCGAQLALFHVERRGVALEKRFGCCSAQSLRCGAPGVFAPALAALHHRSSQLRSASMRRTMIGVPTMRRPTVRSSTVGAPPGGFASPPPYLRWDPGEVRGGGNGTGTGFAGPLTPGPRCAILRLWTYTS